MIETAIGLFSRSVLFLFFTHLSDVSCKAFKKEAPNFGFWSRDDVSRSQGASMRQPDAIDILIWSDADPLEKITA